MIFNAGNIRSCSLMDGFDILLHGCTIVLSEMNTAILFIDIQNDYFPGGKMELEGAEEAALNAAKLLAIAREKGFPVLHIQHLSIRPGATFFLPGTDGIHIHSSMIPSADEQIIRKHYPNGFKETRLETALKNMGTTRIVVAGMMSHMCVDATVRAAFDKGYECVIAHDACASRALTWNGATIPAVQVHGSFMAALNALYATVKSTDEVLGMLSSLPLE